jgi:hypothetical protein
MLHCPFTDWNADEEYFSRYADGILLRSFVIRSGNVNHLHPHYLEVVFKRALQRLEFFRYLAPMVSPRFGYIDYVWGSVVKEKQLAELTVRKLFWSNYFSEPFAEKYGREFFAQIPAWKVEEFLGGYLITVTESFMDFRINEPKETIKYLRQKFKGISAN